MSRTWLAPYFSKPVDLGGNYVAPATDRFVPPIPRVLENWTRVAKRGVERTPMSNPVSVEVIASWQAKIVAEIACI